MKNTLILFLIFMVANAFSQKETQIYSFGGKDLVVSSKYDCSVKYSLISPEFRIANIGIPKWAYNSLDAEELIEEFGKEIEKEFTTLKKRKVEFSSFGQKFQGYLYKIDNDGKISYTTTTFGVIEDPIMLIIAVNNDSLDFENFTIPIELTELIEITDLNK